MKASRTCTIPGCTSPHYGKGLCNMHWGRQRRNGDPAVVRTGHRYTPVDPVERLWQRSEWRGDCLIYIGGYTGRSGHVMMSYDGRQDGVHRVAYAVVHGPIPLGVVIRHSCDTPRCINVAHLLAGTVADNNRDRDERGRHVPLKGERNGQSRLREADIPSIRSRLAAGDSTYTVASAYGVSQKTIWLIKAGLAWAHVPITERNTTNA